MTESDTEARVLALVSDIVGVPVTRASSMDNVPGWDSLKQMQVIFAFEDAFDVRLGDGEVPQMRTVDALVRRASRGS